MNDCLPLKNSSFKTADEAFYRMRLHNMLGSNIGRSIEAENLIFKCNDFNYDYAKYLIKGRWPKAEKFILINKENALLYTTFVLKKRWKKAEKIIFSNKLCFKYIENIIQGRWPKAEKFIFNSKFLDRYLKIIIKKRCKNIEKKLSIYNFYLSNYLLFNHE